MSPCGLPTRSRPSLAASPLRRTSMGDLCPRCLEEREYCLCELVEESASSAADTVCVDPVEVEEYRRQARDQHILESKRPGGSRVPPGLQPQFRAVDTESRRSLTEHSIPPPFRTPTQSTVLRSRAVRPGRTCSQRTVSREASPLLWKLQSGHGGPKGQSQQGAACGADESLTLRVSGRHREPRDLASQRTEERCDGRTAPPLGGRYAFGGLLRADALRRRVFED